MRTSKKTLPAAKCLAALTVMLLGVAVLASASSNAHVQQAVKAAGEAVAAGKAGHAAESAVAHIAHLK